MKMAFDIDGTITAYPQAFCSIVQALYKAGIEIHIITNRESDAYERTCRQLSDYDIPFHYLAITKDKAKYIKESNIKVLYENTDEVFLDIPEDVCVLKVREEMNFDFQNKKWIYDSKTGMKL